MKGVSIAKHIKIMDARTDNEERIIALKLMIKEEEITVVAFYDANNNTDCHLIEIENIIQGISE